MAEIIDPAWKHEVVERSAPAFKPALQSGAGFSHDFKLDWSAGLLLDDCSAISDVATTYDIPNAKLHEVKSPELAINRQVKQRAVAMPFVVIQIEVDRLDIPPWEYPLWSYVQSCIPGVPIVYGSKPEYPIVLLLWSE
ncbi:hypothetical protein NVSP9465_01073 [Novosphingobium sp. CECT 9465]|nr:hypothetical protein NVSP9465_01073 [Novosphingobium sp. CECT 9465]